MGRVELTGRRIVADADKCCGCRVCEMVCSLRTAGVFDPNRSAIHRNTLVPDLRFSLTICPQCPTMPCAQVCLVHAISRDEVAGAVVVDPDLCNLCGACVEACPLEQIVIVDERVLKCDLCGGDPLCVRWCPRGVLSVAEFGVKP